MVPFASTFERCQGTDPISLYDAQRILFAQKKWIALPSSGEPTDWPAIDQSLCEAYGWTPQQIDEMTLPEIRVVCRRQSDKGPALHHIQLKKKLTVKEKLLAMSIASGNY